ncbi:MAG TPA: 5-formyltetrahydrofolate cyclo-ligase [Acidimicrobiia bacterium]|nr:5-formyltetrahydrofolate cyclo-ligase [Acidimicrobiia bacterium]
MDKSELRAMVRAQPPVSSAVSAAVVERLFELMSARIPGTVSAFLAMEGEVDVSPLFSRLPGWRWVLPRVEADRSLTFRDRDVPREIHRFGMSQPIDAGPVIPVHEIDVMLTPGLAFDRHGGRLGNGGGFYDRVLSRRRSDSVAIGVTITARVFDEVPMDDHDQRVDRVVTEFEIIECSTRT